MTKTSSWEMAISYVWGNSLAEIAQVGGISNASAVIHRGTGRNAKQWRLDCGWLTPSISPNLVGLVLDAFRRDPGAPQADVARRLGVRRAVVGQILDAYGAPQQCVGGSSGGKEATSSACVGPDSPMQAPRQMVDLYVSGYSIAKIANMSGVDEDCVVQLVTRESGMTLEALRLPGGWSKSRRRKAKSRVSPVEMAGLYVMGQSLAEVAQASGVSAARVCTLIDRETGRSARQWRLDCGWLTPHISPTLIGLVADTVLRNPATSQADVARWLGVEVAVIRKIVAAYGARLGLAGRDARSSPPRASVKRMFTPREMATQYVGGYSLAEIASRSGVTESRVAQLIKQESGMTSRALRLACGWINPHQRAEEPEVSPDEMADLYVDGHSVPDIGALAGVSASRVSTAILAATGVTPEELLARGWVLAVGMVEGADRVTGR